MFRLILLNEATQHAKLHEQQQQSFSLDHPHANDPTLRTNIFLLLFVKVAQNGFVIIFY